MSDQHSQDRLEELLTEQTDRALSYVESAEARKLLRENPDWSDDDLEFAAAASFLAFAAEAKDRSPAFPAELRERALVRAREVVAELAEDVEDAADTSDEDDPPLVREVIGRSDTVRTPAGEADGLDVLDRDTAADLVRSTIIDDDVATARGAKEQPLADTGDFEVATVRGASIASTTDKIVPAPRVTDDAETVWGKSAGTPAADTTAPRSVDESAAATAKARAPSAGAAQARSVDESATAKARAPSAGAAQARSVDETANAKARAPSAGPAQARSADQTLEAGVPVAANVVSLSSRRLAIGAVVFAAAASIAAAVLAYVAFVAPRDTAIPRASYAAMRTSLLKTAGDTVTTVWSAAGDPLGQAVAGDVVWSDSQQQGFMRFIGLAKNDLAKLQYQLWIFDASRDERFPVDGGVFDVDTDTGEVIVRIDPKVKVTKATLFAVTAERPGGVVVSTRERLLVVAKVL